MNRYTVRLDEGRELGPLRLDQIEFLIKRQKVTITTFVYSEDTGRWHMAGTLPEIRKILRKFRKKIAKAQDEEKSSFLQRARKSLRFGKSSMASTPPVPESNDLYTIRASDGVEYGPSTLEQVKELVKQGRVKATTMIFTQSSKRWHLAASVPEIRALLRQYNPSQDSTLNRIRSVSANTRDSAHAMMAVGRVSSIRVKHPFWKKLFSR